MTKVVLFADCGIFEQHNKVSLHQKPRNRFAHNRIRRNVNCRPNSFRVVVQPLVLGDLRFSPKVQGDARKFLLIFGVWTWSVLPTYVHCGVLCLFSVRLVENIFHTTGTQSERSLSQFGVLKVVGIIAKTG